VINSNNKNQIEALTILNLFLKLNCPKYGEFYSKNKFQKLAYLKNVKLKIKIIIPIRGPEGPRGFQEVKVPRFRENGTGWW